MAKSASASSAQAAAVVCQPVPSASHEGVLTRVASFCLLAKALVLALASALGTLHCGGDGFHHSYQSS